ncbi:F-box protein CPR1-like [Silene latifolia]|uniref:F-box protein CPR1-like n=1 Tax=Silene latifolia TaxID=37657 RepID=UPI003D785ED5
MWNNLPTEISSNILHRLPVKTLIKCTILSKSFLNLITNQPFISDHIAQNANSHLLLRYYTHDGEELYHFEPDDHTFSGFQTDGLIVPFHNYIGDCFNVAGCVNGVLCLVNDFSAEGTLILLWNPCIRKFVHVPRPIIVFDTHGAYKSVCGFGFDSISDDYKVVRLVELDNGIDLGFGVSAEMQVEVYSLKSECWRVIGVGPGCSIKKYYGFGYTPRFINGCVYFLGLSYSGQNYENVLLKFNMCTESFEIIQVTGVLKLIESGFASDLFVLETNQVVTLIKSIYNDASMTCSCSAWILKEDGDVKSWTKICDIDIGKLRPHGMVMAFSFRKNGEVITVKYGQDCYGGKENVVDLIDPVTHSRTTLREISADRYSFYLSTYVESMVLFKEGKGIEEQNTPLKFVN